MKLNLQAAVAREMGPVVRYLLIIVAVLGGLALVTFGLVYVRLTPARNATATYFRDLAHGDVQAATRIASGEALAALRLHTVGNRVEAVPILSLGVSIERGGSNVALEGVTAETGGPLPTLAQYQVLVVYAPEGWRVASVWQGAAPASFGGVATSQAMLATAKDWLSYESRGDFRGALHDLAGGALASAEQSTPSGTAWAKSVRIGAASWQVLGTEGDWGAVEGNWQASTSAGTAKVSLVLLGQMVAGQWRITRVVTLS